VVASGASVRPPSLRRRLNPLHCGAVVASLPSGLVVFYSTCVSIPFIAGQWSLRWRAATPAPRCGSRLNPLHCGAVVASSPPAAWRWGKEKESQSPSLRGSGRFPALKPKSARATPSFNPLHCGAVVASTP